ncbi:23S rRNA (uracil(1939)-C(5))-methyltransferase RlmD [Mycoplasma sp. 128]
MYKINEILTNIHTTEFSYEGLGVYRTENYAIFVFGMLEDEVADIQITKANSRFAFASVVRLINTNPKRIEINNKNLVTSGVAPLAILDYQDQLNFKQSIVEYLFKRQLDFTDINKIQASDKEWNYRNKIVVFVKDFELGFYKKNSHEFIKQTSFDLASEPINKFLQYLNPLIKKYKLTNISRIVARSSDIDNFLQIVFVNKIKKELPQDFIQKITNDWLNVVSIVSSIEDTKNKDNLVGTDLKTLIGTDFLTQKLENFEFNIYPHSFFQVNTQQAVLMYKKMIDKLNLQEGDKVIDMYCGVGTITSFISKKVNRVYGIENIKQAIVNANEAMKTNKLNNIEFILGDASKVINNLKLSNFNVITLDPPRAGLSQEVIDYIIKTNPSKIGYISCNVHTLVRDLVKLKDYYDIEFVQPFDMFPQTHHIEIVVTLSKKITQ